MLTGPSFLPRHQSGVTLLEVLIAMVVLSFGILTAVGLQLVSKRNNIDSRQHMTASILAYDLLERMRANSTPAGLATYSGRTLGSGSMGSAPAADCASATCTPAQLAAYDLWDWEQALDGEAETLDGAAVGGLTNPVACINGPAGGGGGMYTIIITWRGATVLPPGAGSGCGGNDEYRRSITLQAYL